VRSDLALLRYDAAGTLGLKSAILSVYAASHAEPIMVDPWLGPDRFWERLVDLYAPGRDFETVGAWLADELIGYAFGSPRDNAAATWAEVAAALPDIPVSGQDEPIYIFREFAVHPDHQGKGYGRIIHDDLLAPRPERLAHLLVRLDNDRARSAYLSWGWRKIGTSQPFPDAPIMDAMVRTLPLASGR
jgi:GNAT superfamily N-acetyltransferase